MRAARPALCVAVVLSMALTAAAQHRDVVRYEPKYKDPVLTDMEEVDEAQREAAKAKTEEILAEVKAADEAREEAEGKLRFDMSGIARPESPDAFTTRHWHFPPTPQYMTGACWSFATTSFLESEIKRTTGQDIKLSEMWTVYWEFVNKARGFIATRGESYFEHGSQPAALIRVYKEHGAMPRAEYEGVVAEDGRFDQNLMHERMLSLLNWCKEQNFWHEETVIGMVRRILDNTMGRPPEAVRWDGVDLQPQEFLSQICQLDPDDYVGLMSTMAVPFWSRGSYAVPDNWWHDTGYLNVPLDVWFNVIMKAVSNGHTLAIGGDVSEPGNNGFEDIAVIPSFDIPGEFIDQSARELRFNNGSTTDDHTVHLVGQTRLDGHDWFLIKDSNRSSRHGKFEGYFMQRDDYVKLKMLTITVHKDLVREIIDKVDSGD